MSMDEGFFSERHTAACSGCGTVDQFLRVRKEEFTQYLALEAAGDDTFEGSWSVDSDDSHPDEWVFRCSYCYAEATDIEDLLAMRPDSDFCEGCDVLLTSEEQATDDGERCNSCAGVAS